MTREAELELEIARLRDSLKAKSYLGNMQAITTINKINSGRGMMDKLSTLLACLPPSDFKNIFTQEIATLRAKVAELEAQLAKYQSLEPVAYSVMCDGEHPGNVFGQKQTAESMMQSLDESWPEHSRKVVPLYALEK